MPNLATIELYASVLPERTVTLSGMSVTVLLTALDAANRIYDWWYDGEQLTQEQIGTMQGILADARKQLMMSQVGQVKIFSTATIPDCCLICDGASYERIEYPELYAALPAVFITDADNFTVPDMRDFFVYGAVDTSEIGENGGEENVTLTESQIPSHSHSIGGAGTTIAAPGAIPVLTPSLFPGSTGSTGGSGSHNNIPPYIKMLFAIVAV